MATWLAGFPPCLGHELTSAPLTGRGEGVGRAQATHCAGSPPSPVPQDNGLDSASGHSWWGGGSDGHEQEEEGKGGVQG